MYFKHKSHGANRHAVYLDNNTFMVFSYETLVAYFQDNIYYVDEHKYSSTTSKHITQCQPNWARERKEVSSDVLQGKVANYIATQHISQFNNDYL